MSGNGIKLSIRRFFVVLIFFVLLFSTMAYFSGELTPVQAAPMILGGSVVIALAWVLLGLLLGGVSRPGKGE